MERIGAQTDVAKRQAKLLQKFEDDSTGGKKTSTGTGDTNPAPNNFSTSDPDNISTIMSQMPGYGGASGVHVDQAPPNTQIPVSNAPYGGPQVQNPGNNPTASGPGQGGQPIPASFNTPAVNDGLNINSLLQPFQSQPNQMRQSVGMGGALQGNGIPGNPYSGTGGVAPGGVVPSPVDLASMMQRAYALARLRGQPQGMGGTPLAGSGGIPLGYG